MKMNDAKDVKLRARDRGEMKMSRKKMRMRMENRIMSEISTFNQLYSNEILSHGNNRRKKEQKN